MFRKRKFQAAAGEICRSIVAFSGESLSLSIFEVIYDS